MTSGSSGVGSKGSDSYYDFGDDGISDKIEILKDNPPKNDGKVPVRLTIEHGGESTYITLRIPKEPKGDETAKMQKVIKEAVHIHQSMTARLHQLAGNAKPGEAKVSNAHTTLRAEFSKGTFIKVKVHGLLSGSNRGKVSLQKGFLESGGVDWKDLRAEAPKGKTEGTIIFGTRDNEVIAKLAHSIAMREMRQLSLGSAAAKSDLPTVREPGLKSFITDLRGRQEPTRLHKDFEGTEAHLIATYQPVLTQAESKIQAKMAEIGAAITTIQGNLKSLTMADETPDIKRLQIQLNELQSKAKELQTTRLQLKDEVFSMVKAQRKLELTQALPYLDSTQINKAKIALATAQEAVLARMASIEFSLGGGPQGTLSLGSKASGSEKMGLEGQRTVHAQDHQREVSPDRLMRTLEGIANPDKYTAFNDEMRTATAADKGVTREMTGCATDLLLSLDVLSKLKSAGSGVTLERFANTSGVSLAELKSIASEVLGKGIPIYRRAPQADDTTPLSGYVLLAVQKRFEDRRDAQVQAIDKLLAPSSGIPTAILAGQGDDDLRAMAETLSRQAQDFEGALASLTPSTATVGVNFGDTLDHRIAELRGLADLVGFDTNVASLSDAEEKKFSTPPGAPLASTLTGSSSPDPDAGIIVEDVSGGLSSPPAASLSTPLSTVSLSPTSRIAEPLIYSDKARQPQLHAVETAFLGAIRRHLEPSLGTAIQLLRGETITMGQTGFIADLTPRTLDSPIMARSPFMAGSPFAGGRLGAGVPTPLSTRSLGSVRSGDSGDDRPTPTRHSAGGPASGTRRSPVPDLTPLIIPRGRLDTPPTTGTSLSPILEDDDGDDDDTASQASVEAPTTPRGGIRSPVTPGSTFSDWSDDWLEDVSLDGGDGTPSPTRSDSTRRSQASPPTV